MEKLRKNCVLAGFKINKEKKSTEDGKLKSITGKSGFQIDKN